MTEQTLPATHKAWCWTGSQQPLDLQLNDVALVHPSADQVLVRNCVIGLNPVDWKVLGGLEGWTRGHVPGVDGAGHVVAVGDGVSPALLGTRVAYHTSLAADGSFAEYTRVAGRALMHLPNALSFEAAASFPCPALTAWQAISKIPSAPGASILISGAGGAVGHYLLQLAVAHGFAVTAMANERHWQRLRELGAQACIAGPLQEGRVWDGGRNFSAVFDSVSADHAARLFTALRANGHLVAIQDRPSHWPNPPFGLALSMHEVALGALHDWGDDGAWRELTGAGEQMLSGIAAGRMTPERTVARDFRQLPELLEALRVRSFSGKPVISVAG